MSTEKGKVHEAEVIPPDNGKTAGKKKGGKSQAIAKRDVQAVGAPTQQQPRITIEQMILKAIEMDKPELIDKFVAIFEKQEVERKKAAFNAALAAFQLECPVIMKNRAVREKADKGGGVRYIYAAQEDVDRVIKPILGKHGLSYSTSTRIDPVPDQPKQAFLIATCHARHAEGHEKDTEFKAPIDFEAYMTSQQKYASAATFCERYAIKHAFGLTFAGDDDDGQAAGRISPQNARAAKGKVTQPKAKPSAQGAGSDEIKPFAERPQLEPVSESGEGISKATATGFSNAMTHAFKGYGDKAKAIAWAEFKKRFPKIEKLSDVPATPEAQKIILNWIADPQRN